MTDEDRYLELASRALDREDIYDEATRNTRYFLRGVLVGAAGTAALFLLAMGVL